MRRGVRQVVIGQDDLDRAVRIVLPKVQDEVLQPAALPGPVFVPVAASVITLVVIPVVVPVPVPAVPLAVVMVILAVPVDHRLARARGRHDRREGRESLAVVPVRDRVAALALDRREEPVLAGGACELVLDPLLP